MCAIPETNVIKKDWRKVDLKIALCYPNIYRAGMSGFTIQLLYALLNSREDVACERFFLPTENEPILSLESHQPLSRFNLLAFSFQFEEDYLNAIKMLLSSNIELDRLKRKMRPLVIAGGPCIVENPIPLKSFFDFFFIGEIEPILDDFIDGLKTTIEKRSVDNLTDKRGLLTHESKRVERVWIKDIDNAPHPVAQIVPNVDSTSCYMPTFGKTLMIETVRGCGRGCRYCLIGFISRPKRERSISKIEEIIDEGVKYTKVSKISLIGAGASDHSHLEEICEKIVSKGLGLSIPSLHAEAVTEPLIKSLVKGGERTLTIAPEAGSESLREVLNKKMSDEIILEASKTAVKNGIKHIKLYFMIGLPTETKEDIMAIVELSKKIANLGFGSKSIRLSINPLIPKPHTPFQYLDFKSIHYLEESFKLIEKELSKNPKFQIAGLNIKHAQIQALLSVGDERLGVVAEKVVRYGGSLGSWRRAIKEEKIDVNNYLCMKKLDEKLPWNVIRTGVNEPFLKSECKKALQRKQPISF
jgi:radical SAM superfamily enzyme YgiQ (UPF0313 family)